MKDDVETVEKLLDVMDERKFHPQFCVAASAKTYLYGMSNELRKFIIDNDVTDEKTVHDWIEEHIGWDAFKDEK